VCCASAGAERRGGVLCAGPAYVVIPQAKKKKKGEEDLSANARATGEVLTAEQHSNNDKGDVKNTIQVLAECLGPRPGG
jgi:hypothetical protein